MVSRNTLDECKRNPLWHAASRLQCRPQLQDACRKPCRQGIAEVKWLLPGRIRLSSGSLGKNSRFLDTLRGNCQEALVLLLLAVDTWPIVSFLQQLTRPPQANNGHLNATRFLADIGVEVLREHLSLHCAVCVSALATSRAKDPQELADTSPTGHPS